jgi:signal transduction histidine kinase
MNSADKKALRKKLYVNQEVQGAIIVRTVLHWCFNLCAVLLVVVIWTVIRDPSQNAIKLLFEAFVYFSPAIVASVVLLPLLVYDILKISHRVAGPLLRLRCEMGKLAEGHDVDSLKFREHDHWSDLADEFNRLATNIKAERQAARHSEGQPSQELEAVS